MALGTGTTLNQTAGLEKAQALGYRSNRDQIVVRRALRRAEDDSTEAARTYWNAFFPRDLDSWALILYAAETYAGRSTRSDVPAEAWVAGSRDVLEDVFRERGRQVARYGLNQDLKDGTGPDTAWLAPISYTPATEIEKMFRQQYEDYEEETGAPTWVHLVREEIAEAFQETDDARLYPELIQAAALLVSWAEKIKARS